MFIIITIYDFFIVYGLSNSWLKLIVDNKPRLATVANLY